MQMNLQTQSTAAKLVVILCLFIIIFTVGVLAFGEWSGAFSIFKVAAITGANSRVYYPQEFSMCCEETGANDWLPMTETKINKYSSVFSCPDTTSQCRFKQPEVSCPGIGWSHPLGMTGVWNIKYTDQLNTEEDYCSIPVICKSVPVNGKEFKRSESIQYVGTCVDNGVFTNPTNIANLINLIAKGITFIDSKLKIDAIGTKIYYEDPNTAQRPLTDTLFCKAPNTVIYKSFSELQNNEPKDSNILSKIETTVKSTLGKTLKPAVDSTGTAKNANFPLRFGECITGVSGWIEEPMFGNVNPQGQYNGKDVTCNSVIGLTEVTKVSTYSGIDYYAPTSKIAEPANFCCNQQDCDLQFPKGTYGCNNYQCEKNAQSQCVSDIQCEPDGGLNQGANCYKDQVTSKFYLYDAKCVNNKCVTPNKVEVKCCATYCESFGKQCDYNTGCQTVVTPKPDCPPGQCCDGVLNKAQFCSSGLVCCKTGNTHNGECKTQEQCYPTPNACKNDDECSDSNIFTIDTCKKSFIGGILNSTGECNHFDLTPILITLGILLLLVGGGFIFFLIIILIVTIKGDSKKGR